METISKRMEVLRNSYEDFERGRRCQNSSVDEPDMPPGTDCPYPIRILAFFEMIRPYHVVIRI